MGWGRPEIIIGDGSKASRMTFDYVFGQESTQKDLYEVCLLYSRSQSSLTRPFGADYHNTRQPRSVLGRWWTRLSRDSM